MSEFVKEKYNQFYKSIEFERKGLFELIKKEFNSKSVLYPGCSIHVTPSFYFNHVVYVDKSQLSKDFFENSKQVLQLIDGNKVYTESSFWQFQSNDFRNIKNLRDNSVDLLLSVFSGEMIKYCERYVKPKGLILTTSLFSDNESIKNRSDYKLIGLIRCSNEKYKIDYSLQIKKIKESKLRRKSSGFKYIDNEEYYIYQKIKNVTQNNE